jgi:hypothetical protein
VEDEAITRHIQDCPKREVICNEPGCAKVYPQDEADEHKTKSCVPRKCRCGFEFMPGLLHTTEMDCIAFLIELNKSKDEVIRARDKAIMDLVKRRWTPEPGDGGEEMKKRTQGSSSSSSKTCCGR